MRFTVKEPIERGWSADKKYRVEDGGGTSYLLRVLPAGQEGAARATFQTLKRAEALGIPMSRPVEVGTCGEGPYLLFTWIDGVDGEEAIPALPPAEQYAMGREAGRILRAIHTIPAPAGGPDWESYFNGKLDRKLRAYQDCPLKCEGGGAFLNYIAANRHLLRGRPTTWQHGDYHIGNMMVDKAGRIQIIDFNREDFGDPWEEFNRIVWCAQAAPAFARGRIDGYFDGPPPEEFWKLLALYIASNTLSSLPWAIPFGPEEVAVMKRQGEAILKWFGGMERLKPTWYESDDPE